MGADGDAAHRTLLPSFPMGTAEAQGLRTSGLGYLYPFLSWSKCPKSPLPSFWSLWSRLISQSPALTSQTFPDCHWDGTATFGIWPQFPIQHLSLPFLSPLLPHKQFRLSSPCPQTTILACPCPFSTGLILIPALLSFPHLPLTDVGKQGSPEGSCHSPAISAGAFLAVVAFTLGMSTLTASGWPLSPKM